MSKTAIAKIKIPAGEELFRTSQLPAGTGLTRMMLSRYERLYPHIKLTAIKMPGAKNARRLTCRSWVLEYLSALDAEGRRAA